MDRGRRHEHFCGDVGKLVQAARDTFDETRLPDTGRSGEDESLDRVRAIARDHVGMKQVERDVAEDVLEDVVEAS